MSGYTFCINVPWFYFQLPTEGDAVTQCINGDAATGDVADDEAFKCSSYTDEGTAVFSDTGEVKPGFNDVTGRGYNLHACPTKAWTCGSKKYFNFHDQYYNADAVLVPAMHAHDVEVAASSMDGSETCTWMLRSECGMPGFAMKGDNAMTSSDADISVVEWNA